ncbi:MAG: SpoIIE family protein phosphatase [Spirochaetota bacterium]
MNLESIDFNQHRPVKLDGHWEFYWKQLLTPEDFDTCKKIPAERYAEVPGQWNGIKINNTTLRGDGYATYRLKVKTGNHQPQLAIKAIDMRTAYRMFVNGKEVARNGKVGTSREKMRPQYLPLVVNIEDRSPVLDIIVQVSNYHHRIGGFWRSLQLGKNEDLYNMRLKRLNFEFFLFGGLIIMGLYHLGLFVIRRKDPSALYLGLFCLIIAIRPMITGEYFLIQHFPDFNWEVMLKLEYLSLYMGVFLFATFLHSVFPDEFSRPFLRVTQVISAAMSAMVMVTVTRLYSHTVQAFEVFTLLVSLYAVYVVARAIINRRDGALFFLAGIIILLITVTNEILYDNMIIDTGNYFALGLLLFILAQAFLLSVRYSRAFTSVENLSMELDLKNRELMDIDRLKDDFLANVSHELRTPLNGIIGIAESIHDGAAGKMTQMARHNLSMIVHSGTRLSNLVNDLLDFSRLKHSDIALNLQPLDMKSVVDLVLDLSRNLSGSKDLSLINLVPEDAPRVLADENRIQQVLLNLVDNAVKFTDHGEILFLACPEEDYLAIYISDTGIGIDQKNIERIFEPFEQADGSISRLYGGTGIGLSISSQLITLHGGTITAESEPGSGTTIRITLPLFKSVAPALTESGQKTRIQDDTYVSPKDAADEDNDLIDMDDITTSLHYTKKEPPSHPSVIMIVDDDPVNLQVLENHLILENYSVSKFTSGIAALKAIESGLAPDLMLLDIMMPRISGYDVARTVREKYTLFELPIILITAKNAPADIITGFNSGANDYISKPFSRGELLARVHTMLALKKAISETKKLSGIEHEMNLARNIQQSIIPKCPPVIPGFSIAATFIPMQSIGGDYYDFHVLDHQHVGILMTDVFGHGLGAALIASMIKIVFYMQRTCADNPVQFLMEMNHTLSNTIENLYLTAGYAFIDRDKGTIAYANAAHPPMVIYRRNTEELIECKPRGRLIGWLEDIETECIVQTIQTGDRIVLYTDGIVEAHNERHELFGYDAFYSLIAENSHLPPSLFTDFLFDQLREWTGNPDQFQDDASIVVVDIE